MAMSKEHDQDREKRRRKKNWALLGVLLAFVVIVYFVSIIRMSGG